MTIITPNMLPPLVRITSYSMLQKHKSKTEAEANVWGKKIPLQSNLYDQDWAAPNQKGGKKEAFSQWLYLTSIKI